MFQSKHLHNYRADFYIDGACMSALYLVYVKPHKIMTMQNDQLKTQGQLDIINKGE